MASKEDLYDQGLDLAFEGKFGEGSTITVDEHAGELTFS